MIHRDAPILLGFGACVLFAVISSNGSNGTTTGGNDVAEGKEVFRFETFGNERFWTEAARVPKGMMDARVTPLQLLTIGVSVDIEALDGDTRRRLEEQLKADPTGRTSRLLNDPATTVALVNANAILGMPIKPGPDGANDVTRGARLGVTCALSYHHRWLGGSTWTMADPLAAGATGSPSTT